MAVNLGALLKAATVSRLGYADGKRKAEDRTLEMQLDVRRTQALRAKEELERRSLTMEMAKLQRDLETPPEWRPTSQQEYEAVHPTPARNIDPNSAEGRRARLEYERAERALGPKPSSAGEKWKESAQINPKTGKPETVQINSETGAIRWLGTTPASTRDAAATEGERKAQVLSSMSQDAYAVLDSAKPPSRPVAFMSRHGLNEGLNADQQKVQQAGMVLADAYIRLTSGANAPDAEVQRAFQMLTPRPGDTDAVLAQKKAFRDRVRAALEQAAGRANRPVPTPGTVPSTNPLDN